MADASVDTVMAGGEAEERVPVRVRRTVKKKGKATKGKKVKVKVKGKGKGKKAKGAKGKVKKVGKGKGKPVVETVTSPPTSGSPGSEVATASPPKVTTSAPLVPRAKVRTKRSRDSEPVAEPPTKPASKPVPASSPVAPTPPAAAQPAVAAEGPKVARPRRRRFRVCVTRPMEDVARIAGSIRARISQAIGRFVEARVRQRGMTAFDQLALSLLCKRGTLQERIPRWAYLVQLVQTTGRINAQPALSCDKDWMGLNTFRVMQGAESALSHNAAEYMESISKYRAMGGSADAVRVLYLGARPGSIDTSRWNKSFSVIAKEHPDFTGLALASVRRGGLPLAAALRAFNKEAQAVTSSPVITIGFEASVYMIDAFQLTKTSVLSIADR